MRRLRVIWFLLGSCVGGLIAYSIASCVYKQELSQRSNVEFKYAELDYRSAATKIVQPVVKLVPVPSMPQQTTVQALPNFSETKTAVPDPNHISIRVRRGDTLTSMLMAHGATHDEAFNIMHGMKKVYNPQRLTAGQSVELSMDRKAGSTRRIINGMSIAVSPLRTVTMVRTADNAYIFREVKRPVSTSLMRGGGVITSSLYQTAADSGIPSQMMGEIINAFSYDVDFQRDIHEGDRLDVVYERVHTDRNVTTGYGRVIYASLNLGGEQLAIYRHDSSDGYSGFYSARGESVKKALLRTPINGSHITSGFGMRMHPLLGYSRMHKGVDFGASTGTPIYAAGDGTIEIAGRHAGYGNYVRIRHTPNYETAYGHASRIARGIRPGAHVKQGQVIAYVGSTGMSTGPHLHYEILVNGKQVNPSGVKFHTGQVLAGHELSQFLSHVSRIKASLPAIPRNSQVASLQ